MYSPSYQNKARTVRAPILTVLDQAVRRPKQDENPRQIVLQLRIETTYLACLIPRSRPVQDIYGSRIPLQRLSHPLTLRPLAQYLLVASGMALSIVYLLEVALTFQKTSFLTDSRSRRQGSRATNFQEAVSEHEKSEGQSSADGLNVDYVRRNVHHITAACRFGCIPEPVPSHCKNFHSRVSCRGCFADAGRLH